MEQDLALIRCTLRLNGSQLVLDRMSHCYGNEPDNSSSPDEEVSSSVFGYWVDVVDARNKVLYRRFLTNAIPLNLGYTCTIWDKRRQRTVRFCVEVPFIENAHALVVYEQSLLAKGDKAPTRRKHLLINLEKNLRPVTFGALCLAL